MSTMKVGATTFTLPSDREIALTRVVDAPRRKVFEAWTDPQHLPSWFGRRGWTMPVCEIDLRPGGAWRFLSKGPTGTQMGMYGVYREISPYDRLVYTESFDDFPGETLNTLLLTDEDAGKTMITCTSLYPTKEARDAVLKTRMTEGASESLDRLEEHLRAPA
jgi:uncharacterized protein YndB with AHSA1/START domain